MQPHRLAFARNNSVPRPCFRACVALALGCAATVLCADSFPDWAHRQELRVDTAGLVKISLPTATLDRARGDLADVRIVDPQGNETPYLIERPRPTGETRRAAAGFRAVLEPEATVLIVETGTTDALEGVTLRTPAVGFIKAVQVEASQDDNNWILVGAGLPLFRQAEHREEQLHLPLPVGGWRHLRMTISDRGSAPVPFTGAQIHLAPARSMPTTAVEVRLVAREETRGETRLILDLGAARLPLAEIEVGTPEPFFRRQVRLVASQVEGITIQERELARGMIYRTTSVDHRGPDRVRLALDLQTPGRELVLLIANADSPPLQVDQIRLRRWPVHLAFWAAQPGQFRIYTGNPVCRSPEYVLPTQDMDLGRTPVSTVELSLPEPNPNHQHAAVLPQVDEIAGQLDLSDWSFRKPVGVEMAGVQELELDLDVLAYAQPGHADLRLVLGNRQVPYILERRSVLRPLKPIVRHADDPVRPRNSRWLIQLPHSNLPVTRLTCASSTALFRRELVLYEEPTDQRGGRYRRQLGRAMWVQTPDRASPVLTMELQGAPITETLYIETDNEDNPPLQLSDFEFGYPVVRLLFKSSPGAELFLYYGNPRIAAPEYDLSLVAEQLIAADKATAYLGEAERLRTASWGPNQSLGKAGILFWGVLVLVVVGLLILIARLVPKSNDSQPPQ